MVSDRRKPKCGDKHKRSDVSSDEIDDVRLISARETRRLLGGVSEMYLWRLLNNPSLKPAFPKPIKINDATPSQAARGLLNTRNFFRFREVIDWIEQRAAVSGRAAA